MYISCSHDKTSRHHTSSHHTSSHHTSRHHTNSHHTINHDDVYDRLRDMIEQGRLTREDANTAQESPAGRRTLGRRTRTPASSIPRAARWRKS